MHMNTSSLSFGSVDRPRLFVFRMPAACLQSYCCLRRCRLLLFINAPDSSTEIDFCCVCTRERICSSAIWILDTERIRSTRESWRALNTLGVLRLLIFVPCLSSSRSSWHKNPAYFFCCAALSVKYLTSTSQCGPSNSSLFQRTDEDDGPSRVLTRAAHKIWVMRLLVSWGRGT